jgi:tetratricopeptide (TPR) repeat protein
MPDRASRPPAAASPGQREGTLEQRVAEAAAALQRGDAAAAGILAREAGNEARACGADARLLGEACVYEAIASNILFDYTAAYERALEAQALLADGPHALRVRAINACFVACAETGDLTRALEHSRRAMQVARAGGDAEAMARVLHNRGSLLQRLGECDEAVRCLGEAVRLFETVVHCSNHVMFTRINLADACLAHARQLAQHGEAARAAVLRHRAAQVLPALAANDAPEAQLNELSALDTWVVVQSELGHLGEARRGARRYLRIMRQAGAASRYRAYALAALAAYHQHRGEFDKSIRRQEAAIARLRQAGSEMEALEAQERLGHLHAACGRHTQALAWLRAAHAGRQRLQVAQAQLRCRLAGVERDVARRRAAHLETAAHTQRLAVVGRLMADIYHALDTPITQAQRTLARCAEPTPPPAALMQALRRVIAQVDAATGLARQLKMFSYRAAPQAMVVDLRDSLVEAWDGVALWRRGAARALHVEGELGTQVRVDAQRLAVLLRILLIEADKGAPVAAVSARIERGTPCSSLELGCLTEGSVSPTGVPRGNASVGLTLCQEIVQEMGGRLTRTLPARCNQGFLLELPAP